MREAVREIGAEGMRAGEIIRRLRQMVRNDEQDERTPDRRQRAHRGAAAPAARRCARI